MQLFALGASEALSLFRLGLMPCSTFLPFGSVHHDAPERYGRTRSRT
jgi:hypothetical protein